MYGKREGEWDYWYQQILPVNSPGKGFGEIMLHGNRIVITDPENSVISIYEKTEPIAQWVLKGWSIF